MKKIYFVVLVILGLLALVFGVWAKTLHKEYAATAMTVALIFEVTISAIFIWLLFIWLKSKSN